MMAGAAMHRISFGGERSRRSAAGAGVAQKKLRSSWELRMNILPLATAAATAIAFSAAPSAKAFQAAAPEALISEAEAAKLFRAIAPLVGTRWNDGSSETYSISWKQPGQILLIRREGLFGTYETLVMPSADKKALRYLSHNVGAGSFGDIVVKGSGKLLL